MSELGKKTGTEPRLLFSSATFTARVVAYFGQYGNKFARHLAEFGKIAAQIVAKH